MLVLLSTVLSVPVSAHSGRTDSNGGHTNHQTGEYHYHHGYPAHQHPNGICPYKASNNSSTQSSSNQSSDNSVLELIAIVVGVPVSLVAIALLYVHIHEQIDKRKK